MQRDLPSAAACYRHRFMKGYHEYLLCCSHSSAFPDHHRRDQTAVPDVPAEAAFEFASGIEFEGLNSFQMESLQLLGRVWAFLKYHHPLPCSGEVNWDHELFRVLPAVLAATTMPQREAALMGLLPSVDPLPPVELSPPPEDSIRFRGDHSWIKGSEIGNSLAFLLNSVLEGRHTGASYYARRGAPPLFHEEEYSLPPFPTAATAFFPCTGSTGSLSTGIP